MSIFGAIFRPPEIQVAFDGADARPHKDVTLEQKGTTEKLPIYGGSEAVTGTVTINTKSKIEHIGIKVELIGQIEFFHDDHPYEFISLVRELEANHPIVACIEDALHWDDLEGYRQLRAQTTIPLVVQQVNNTCLPASCE